MRREAALERQARPHTANTRRQKPTPVKRISELMRAIAQVIKSDLPNRRATVRMAKPSASSGVILRTHL